MYNQSTELDDLLTCPICLDALSAPTYQCRNGHVLCTECRDQMNDLPINESLCPVCRVPFGSEKIRNLVADALIEAKHGCCNEPLGIYQIVCESGVVEVTKEFDIDSEVVDALGPDVYVEVAEVRYGLDRRLKRLRLVSGVWIGAGEDETKRWAQPVPLGVYKIIAETPHVSDGVVGEYVEIVEIRFSSDGENILGRLPSGYWIHLVDVKRNLKWAEPVPLGLYETVAPSTVVSDGILIGSQKIKTLAAGNFIMVVEVRRTHGAERIRGRLASGGWISLIHTESGFKWANPLPRGVYKTIAPATAITTGPSIDSEKVNVLYAGEYIQINELKRLPHGKRIRGRLSSGGWISLISTETLYKWAEPMPLTVHRTIALDTAVYDKPISNNDAQVLRSLNSGVYFEFSELKLCKEIHKILGRFNTGEWITLLDIETGARSSIPLQLGMYKTTASATAVGREMSIYSQVIRTLHAGEFIEIVEIFFAAYANRIRGRMALGGWISLIDTETGFVWAEPSSSGKRKKKTLNDSREEENDISINSHVMTKLSKFVINQFQRE